MGTNAWSGDHRGTESATFEVDLREGHIRANDMIVFIYLTDVHEGDGGLGKLRPLPIPHPNHRGSPSPSV